MCAKARTLRGTTKLNIKLNNINNCKKKFSFKIATHTWIVHFQYVPICSAAKFLNNSILSAAGQPCSQPPARPSAQLKHSNEQIS